MTDRRAVRVFVSGRVQGVGYRDWTVDTARQLGLTGWVRNRRDGRVEAVFDGAAPVVARMLEACRTGPPAARVAALESTDLGTDGIGAPAADFRLLPTI